MINVMPPCEFLKYTSEFNEPVLAPRATLATNLRPNVILYLLPSLSQMYPLPIEPNRVSDHGTEE